MKILRNTLLLIAFSVLPLWAISATQLRSALDSPAGVTFTVGKGTVDTSDDTPKHVYGRPNYKGSNYLMMNANSSSSKFSTSDRISSRFSITVKGAGTLTYGVRTSTYGDNYDGLYIFDNVIDDDVDEGDHLLGEHYGDYWYESYKEDGEWYFDLDGEDFFDEESVDVDTNSYTHTIHFVATKAYKGEDYESPETEDDEYYTWKVYLDNFVWTPDEDIHVVEFDPAPGESTFDAKDLIVDINTDYDDDVLKFYFTTDGSNPTTSSKRYYPELGGTMGSDGKVEQNGVHLTKTTTLKVAAYEGSTLIDVYEAAYVKEPTFTFANNAVFATPGATITMAADVSGANIYYTTDGTDPTTASTKGTSCTVTGPCTIKAITEYNGKLSAVADLRVQQAATPKTTWLCDNYTCKKIIYNSQVTLTSICDSKHDIHYRVDNGAATKYTAPITLSSACKVTFQAQGSNTTATLHSPFQTIVIPEPCVEDTATLANAVNAMKAGQWNLWGCTKEIAPETGVAVANYLQPYGYDPATKSMVRMTMVEPGQAYWVYGKPTGTAPAFKTNGVAATPATGTTWHLVSTGATWSWNGVTFYQVSEGTTDAPGWKEK